MTKYDKYGNPLPQTMKGKWVWAQPSGPQQKADMLLEHHPVPQKNSTPAHLLPFVPPVIAFTFVKQATLADLQAGNKQYKVTMPKGIALCPGDVLKSSGNGVEFIKMGTTSTAPMAGRSRSTPCVGSPIRIGSCGRSAPGTRRPRTIWPGATGWTKRP